VDATPDADDCEGGLMDVALSVSTSFAVTLTCEWDFFGNGSVTSGSFLFTGPGTDVQFHPYPPGTHTAKLSIVGCPEQSKTFTVPECPTATTTSTSTGTDDDGGFSLCGLFCAIWVVLLAGYLVGIATGLLANPLALAIATAALVAFSGFYIALCGVCRYARCTLIGVGLFVLVVILLLIFSVALPGLLAAAIAAAGFLAAALLILRVAC
jgi:hypothetical protein